MYLNTKRNEQRIQILSASPSTVFSKSLSPKNKLVRISTKNQHSPITIRFIPPSSFLNKRGKKRRNPPAVWHKLERSTCCRGIEFPFSSAGTFVGAISLVERFGRFRSAVNYGNGEECLADIIFPRDGSFNIVGFLAAGGMPRFRVENHLAASDSRSRARSRPAQDEQKKKTVT